MVTRNANYAYTPLNMLAKTDDKTFLNNLITPVNTQQQTQSALSPWRSELAKKQGLAAMNDKTVQNPWTTQEKFNTGINMAQTGFGIWNGIQSQKIAGEQMQLEREQYNLNKAGMLDTLDYNAGVDYRRRVNAQGGRTNTTEADYIKNYSPRVSNLA